MTAHLHQKGPFPKGRCPVGCCRAHKPTFCLFGKDPTRLNVSQEVMPNVSGRRAYRLDLVTDEQYIMLCAQLANFLQVPRRRDNNAAALELGT